MYPYFIPNKTGCTFCKNPMQKAVIIPSIIITGKFAVIINDAISKKLSSVNTSATASRTAARKTDKNPQAKADTVAILPFLFINGAKRK